MKHSKLPPGEFAKVIGITPRNLVLEYLLELEDIETSIGDMAQDLGLNRATAYNIMDELIENKYVVCTRKISGVRLFTLNLQKKEVQLLLKMFDMVLQNIEFEEKEIIC